MDACFPKNEQNTLALRRFSPATGFPVLPRTRRHHRANSSRRLLHLYRLPLHRLPPAILPPYVHLQLGYGTVLAGLVISAQYVATVLSRPRAGRMVDSSGPKRVVVFGLLACAGSGAWTFAAAFFAPHPHAALALLLIGRLTLGVGESMVATGAMLWGIGRAGSHHIAKVI